MLRGQLQQVEDIKRPPVEVATAILKELQSQKKQVMDNSIELELTAKRQQCDYIRKMSSC